VVPKGTPKDIIAKLNAALRDAMADDAVRRRLAALALISRCSCSGRRRRPLAAPLTRAGGIMAN
jgi:tripartite-type tricarboxylate transporter receptor subunit TctC